MEAGMGFDEFVATSAEMGIPLSLHQQAQLKRYWELLIEWNGRMNLTAVRDPNEMLTRHFLDSLHCLNPMGDLSGQRVVDVGTGAGFPGLVLKIVQPDLALTLVESVGKKCTFLEAVSAELALSDVSVVNRRAEEIGQDPALRASFDWALARAVAELRVLAEYLLPLCRIGGHMLAMKGERAAEELASAETALVQLGGGDSAEIPVGEQSTLIVVPKVAPTPAKYPRRTGMPSKRPL